MTLLGSQGRFGNQLLQYAFARLYAKQYGLVAEFPDWIGRDLFDLDDPFPSAVLPKIDESSADLFGAFNGTADRSLANHDIAGFFAGDTKRWGGRSEEFRALFVPGAKVRPFLDQAAARIALAGRTLVAIHLRRGDFGYGRFWVAPPAWYLRWLRALWPSLENPILYVATDAENLIVDFAEFSPWHAGRLGVDLPGADFFIDHYFLQRANYLAISNSSFSFTAAMLNATARSFMRPHPGRRELTAFDPWSAEVLLDPVVDPAPVTDAERTAMRTMLQAGQNVLHLGRHCSPWTNLARSVYPGLRIMEADGESSVDCFRRGNGNVHIQHLIVEEAASLPRAVAQAEKSLGHARVDMLHFRLEHGHDIAQAVASLKRNGYVLYRIGTDRFERIDGPPPFQPGSCIALQERLLPLFSRVQTEGLDLAALCKVHRIKVRGVLHVGAHEGREIAQYDALQAERVVFIEANPEVFARLSAAMRERPNVLTVQRAVSDRAGKLRFHLASFDQSSSLLPMARHREVYPQIVEAGVTEVDATPLDELMKELALPPEQFNLLNIDVQGAEAMVLRGAASSAARIARARSSRR